MEREGERKKERKGGREKEKDQYRIAVVRPGLGSRWEMSQF